MEMIYVKKAREVAKHKSELEKMLEVELSIVKGMVTFSGNGMAEHEASQFFNAMNFGFSVKRALLLKNDDFVFKVVHIREHTKRNLKDIKARLIGKRGKTRRTLAQISGCEVLISEAEVGIIGEAEAVEDTEVAVINLIKGSKQSHMYKYLEKMNKSKKDEPEDILG